MADHPDPAELHPDPADLDASPPWPGPAELPPAQDRPQATEHVEFAAFYRESLPRLVAFLRYQGACLADAVELAQEAMSEAFRSWPTIRHPKTWVRVVAARNLLRQLSTVDETPTEPLPEPSTLLRISPVVEWEQRHDILRLIDRLPHRQRQVMAWKFDGYTPKEIAEMLGMEQAAVRQNLHRARVTLADQLRARRGEDTRDA